MANLKQFLAEADAAPDFAKYLRAAEKKVRSDLTGHFKHKPSPKLEVKILSPYKAKMTIEFQSYLDPKSIEYAENDFKDALVKADINGHVHKIELGDASVGFEFVDAILGSLRPGMKVVAEAFFPTLEFEITFKQIVSRRG